MYYTTSLAIKFIEAHTHQGTDLVKHKLFSELIR
jgi:hypothetical protein